MTCGTCGAPLVPGARYCASCGVPAEAASTGPAERRIVTVLFGDLTDFTAWAEDLDPERVGVVTDGLLAALSTAVTDVGGHVDKLTGDGIMAVFGAPTGHEDDAERAVLAAWAMQQAADRLVAEEAGGGRRLGLRVGLNTGEVLAGVQAHLSYTVVGDTVNTASRLADAAAPGTVYAGRETATATMRVGSWRTLSPLRLKGKREPVPAYELVGLRARTTTRLGLGDEAPTIGREAEIGALTGQLRSVVERGSPAAVLLAGEAGAGKTRLAHELVRVAERAPDTRVLWAQCIPYGLARDLAPLAQLVRTACGVGAGDPPDLARERVGRAVGRLSPPPYASWAEPELTARLLGLLGLGPDRAGGGGPDSTPGVRVERPDVDGIVALLSALAYSGPVVVVVDDLHAASEVLRGLLVEVMGRVRGPVLFVGSGRSLDDAAWAGLPAVSSLPVQPLEPMAAERLLAAYLGGGDLGGEDRAQILARAGGNPFFLAEMLHLLVDQGLLVRGVAGWTLSAGLPTGLLPAGVHAVLAARVDTLDPPARGLLRSAAVLGAEFSADALAAVDPGVDAAMLPDRLRELVERGLLRQAGPDRWTFTHTLAREVAYAGLPKAERARRHAAVARWAAGSGAGDAGDADAMAAAAADAAVRLAGEMSLPATDPARLVAPVGLGAARRLVADALARSDHVSAESHALRALRLAEASPEPPDAGVVASVGASYAQALAGQRRLDEAEAALDGPLTQDDPAVCAQARLVLGEIRRARGDEEGARESYLQAAAVAEAHGLTAPGATAVRELGLLDLLHGRFRDAEARFRQALDQAELAGDRRGAGWALQRLAWSATTRADYRVALDALRRASEIFLAMEDTAGLTWCAGTEALVDMLQGRHREARDLVAGLLPLAEQMGAGWEVAACRTIDAVAAAELGDLDAAEELCRLARDGFEQIGDSWGQAMAALGEGIVARGRGRTRAARTALRRSVALAADAHHQGAELMATVLLGLLHLDRDDTRGASRTADRAAALAADLELTGDATSAQLVLRAQVLRRRGVLDEAYDLLAAAAAADQPTLLFPRRQAVAHLAGVLLQRGDVTAARTAIDDALGVPAEDVRSQVVTRRVLAEVLSAEGDVVGAGAAADEALALVEASGLLGELPATHALLERLGSS